MPERTRTANIQNHNASMTTCKKSSEILNRSQPKALPHAHEYTGPSVNTTDYGQQWSKSGQILPGDLALVVNAWKNLSPDARKRILAILEAELEGTSDA